eukprot:6065738-Pleurochrysis_carterae.AAC.1
MVLVMATSALDINRSCEVMNAQRACVRKEASQGRRETSCNGRVRRTGAVCRLAAAQTLKTAAEFVGRARGRIRRVQHRGRSGGGDCVAHDDGQGRHQPAQPLRRAQARTGAHRRRVRSKCAHGAGASACVALESACTGQVYAISPRLVGTRRFASRCLEALPSKSTGHVATPQPCDTAEPRAARFVRNNHATARRPAPASGNRPLATNLLVTLSESRMAATLRAPDHACADAERQHARPHRQIPWREHAAPLGPVRTSRWPSRQPCALTEAIACLLSKDDLMQMKQE